MDKQQPRVSAEVILQAESAIQEFNDELKSLARDHKRLKRRVDDLAIFENRVATNGDVKQRSDIAFDSSPEEELLFKHRNIHTGYMARMVKFENQLSSVDKDGLDAKGLETLRKILHGMSLCESKANEQLERIGDILSGLRDQLDKKQKKMIEITHKRAELLQAALMHADKMQLTMQANSGDLLATLAKRYGVTIDEAREMVEAKPALTAEIENARSA